MNSQPTPQGPPGALPSDEDLMDRVTRRDADALAELYDRHSGRLFGLIVKLVADRGEAEDVLQQVFWLAWRDAAKYDRRLAAPAVWLLLMARSRALDHLRRRGRRLETVTRCPDPPERADPGPDPRADIRADPRGGDEPDEPGARARRALDRLPDEQREVLCLAFYRGLSHPQIAHSQSVPLGTVKTRIRLGMSKLRELLQEYEVSPT